MKKPFETEMDDTRQAVGQIVCLCTTIALHQEFGVGKTRLERIKARIDELENQNTEVIMTPDANGRPSKDKAEAIRESWLAGCVSSDYRIPMVRMPRGRKEQQYRMAGDRAAKIAWQIYAKAVIDVLHYGPDRLERLRKESHANYIGWQSGKMGRDINPDKLRYLLLEVGIKRVDLRQPIFTPLEDGKPSVDLASDKVPQVAKVGTVTVKSGGYEDE